MAKKVEVNDTHLGIRIGALSPKLHEQINEQVSFEVTAEEMEFEQRLVDSVVLLQIHSIITFGEQQKVGNRVMKKIMKRVDELAEAYLTKENAADDTPES